MSLIEKMMQARDHDISEETAKSLVKNQWPSVRIILAQNLAVSQEILKALSTDENATVRWNVLLNDNSPIEFVFEFSQDNDSAIKKQAIKMLEEMSENQENILT